jgi:opacity protein-like surface antigen
LTPYVLAGGGFARVTKDVHFILNGTDITGAIDANPDQYGVALGSDLAGTTNNGLLVIGGGVTWTAWRQLVVDFGYRYGRVFSEDINTNRAGVGIGWRF